MDDGTASPASDDALMPHRRISSSSTSFAAASSSSPPSSPAMVPSSPSFEIADQRHAAAIAANRAPPPYDRFAFVYTSFIILGVGFLLPWNALLSAVDYLQLQWPGEGIESRIASVYTVGDLLTMALSVMIGMRWGWKNNRTANKTNEPEAILLDSSHQSSSPVSSPSASSSSSCRTRSSRVLRQLATYLLTDMPKLVAGFACLFITLIASSNTESSSIFLFLTFIIAVGDGLVQVTLYGIAGVFPPIYTGAVMIGVGFAGVVTAGLRVITKLSYPNTPDGVRASSLLYFWLSGAVTAICMILPFAMKRSAFFQYYYQLKHKPMATNSSDDVPSSPSNNGRSSDDTTSFASLPQSAVGVTISNGGNGHHAGYGAAPTDGDDSDTNHHEPSSAPIESNTTAAASSGYVIGSMRYYGALLWRLRGYLFGVSMTYVSTLAVFPGVVAELQSSAGTGDWFPVLLIIIMQIFDLVGRWILRWNRFVWFSSGRSLVIASIIRFIFIPLIMGLVFAKHEYAHGDTRTIVAVFAHDWMAYSVITLLAFTNGYVSCIAMMFAPNQATTHDEGEVIGSFMALFLVIGLTVGAQAGLGFVALLP